MLAARAELMWAGVSNIGKLLRTFRQASFARIFGETRDSKTRWRIVVFVSYGIVGRGDPRKALRIPGVGTGFGTRFRRGEAVVVVAFGTI